MNVRSNLLHEKCSVDAKFYTLSCILSNMVRNWFGRNICSSSQLAVKIRNL